MGPLAPSYPHRGAGDSDLARDGPRCAQTVCTHRGQHGRIYQTVRIKVGVGDIGDGRPWLLVGTSGGEIKGLEGAGRECGRSGVDGWAEGEWCLGGAGAGAGGGAGGRCGLTSLPTGEGGDGEYGGAEEEEEGAHDCDTCCASAHGE